MAFKLIEAAQSGWRAVNAPTWSRSCALARSSRTNGKLVERPDEPAADKTRKNAAA